MRIAETLVLHGFAAVDLVDGGAAEGSPASQADGEFELSIDDAPRGLRVSRRGARVVFALEGPSTRFLPHGRAAAELIDLAAPAGTLSLAARAADAPADCGEELTVQGVADAGLRTPPERPDLRVAGSVADASGRWLPRRFAVDLARGTVSTLPLWPAPAARRGGSGGALIARVWFGDDAGTPTSSAAFALATLSVQIGPAVTRRFSAMTDANGDLALAPGRVPPVVPGLGGYPATLRVRASVPADPHRPALVLPESQPARSVGDTATRLAGDLVRWLPELEFTWVPGRRTRLVTRGSTDLLLVQQP